MRLILALLRQVLKATATAVWVGLVVGVLSFLALRALPGDDAYRVAAARYGHDLVDGHAAAAVRAELAGDAAPGAALWRWLCGLAQGELGVSRVNAEPVAALLAHEAAASLSLAGAALALALLGAVPLGLASGLRPGGAVDRLSLALAAVLRAVPPFVLGLLLMLLMSVQAGVLPVADPSQGGGPWLPALTLALPLAAGAARVLRETVLTVAASPAWAFACSKGLPAPVRWWRHGLRVAVAPLLSWLGVQAVLLVEGVVVVESLFARPGLGHALVHAIFGRDVPVLQGAALALGGGLVLFNLLLESALLLLDPRRRDGEVG
ncbi:ABC transporter permease subunit [Ideonella livida]|uniref:ABC transporter permease subunit n=1 Tax=Ideonella livida TaxID=2707176 RepID=UPI001EF3B3EE|nr:ABC transporter permease subunit [Ideonella livida]